MENKYANQKTTYLVTGKIISGTRNELKRTRGPIQKEGAGNVGDGPVGCREGKKGLEGVRELAPDIADRMKKLLDGDKVSPLVKVRIMEIIMEYTYGRPENTIKVMNVQQSVEAAESRIAAFVETVRRECGMVNKSDDES